jgi:hypothetical protein
MTEQTIRRPLSIADLDDHLRAHPMHPRQHQRRAETTTARRRSGERHPGDRERMKALPQALKLGDGHTGADSARIDELALRRVVAEQQRTDPMPTALRVTPPDDNEFLAVDAFRLQPRAPIGLIPTIKALRDNAFEAVLAGQAMEGRALADLMVVIPQRLRRTDQERLQPSLAIHQRQVADVLAIQKQQVNKKKTSDPWLASAAFWIRLKAVLPSGSTPQSSPSR